MKYRPLKGIFNYIPKGLREHQEDDPQWISWALQYLRTVETAELVQKDFALLQVTGRRATLPKGLRKITSIKMIAKLPTEQERTSLDSCITIKREGYDITSGTNTDGRIEVTQEGSAIHYFQEGCGLYVDLFKSSLFVKNCMMPMKFVGVTHKDYFSKACYQEMKENRCVTNFSITSDGCILADRDGFVCIEYETEIKDGTDFMAPERPIQLWQAMAAYAIAQHWQNRTSYKEQNAMKMYLEYLELARNYMREAKGIMRMKNISFSLMQAITSSDTNVLGLPSVFSNKLTRYGEQ